MHVHKPRHNARNRYTAKTSCRIGVFGCDLSGWFAGCDAFVVRPKRPPSLVYLKQSKLNAVYGRGKEMMSILLMIIVGLVVGAVAKLLMPGRDPGGMIITILLGIAGSIVAGFLGRSLGWYAEGAPVGFIASVIGAILLLAVYRALTGSRSRVGA